MLSQQIKQVPQRMFIKDWLGQKKIQIKLEIKEIIQLRLEVIEKLNKEVVNGLKNIKTVLIVRNRKDSLRSNIVNMVVISKYK